MRLFVEIRHRGLLKVATAYLAVTWLTLEIGHTLFNIFELPHAGLQFVFVLLVIGFPIVMLGCWQGWFGALAHDEPQGGHEGHHTANPHQGPWLAVVFAAVALFAVAVAIGVRFLGMGNGSGHESHHDSKSGTADVPHAMAGEQSIPPAAAVFAPPPHSVAVLSFVNLSGDPKDEYFSDGLSEELLNTLVRLEGLQVAARASSFSFKGKDVDIPTVGRKLNVGAILEGSVRKAGPRVRITAQLENTVSGFHLWSQTYDRELKDIFALQTEIATAVTEALQVRLLREDREKLRDAGTNDPRAFDAYLRGRSARAVGDESALRAAMDAFGEAIELDAKYVLAHAGRAEARATWANDWIGDAARRKALFDEARGEAQEAVRAAPSSGQASAALATVLELATLDFSAIGRAWRRAVELEPGNGELLRDYAFFAARIQRADAEQSAERAVSLNPLDPEAYRTRGQVLFYLRRFGDARQPFRQALALGDSRKNRFWAAWNELAAGKLDEPVRVCERDVDSWYAQNCLAIAYHRQGRHAEAEKILARMQKEQGDLLAAQYSEIYAQWGQVPLALDWLEKAYALRDPGLEELKVDPFLDPIRDEPRFKAIVRLLNFPE